MRQDGRVSGLPGGDLEPVIVVVDADGLGEVAAELTARYGRDYTVCQEGESSSALDRLSALVAAGREIALILAGQRLPERDGVDFLVAAHRIAPTARRGLLMRWGDRSALAEISRAAARGTIDYFLPRPVYRPDERFHRAITEFLDEWWRLRGRWFEVARVIGDGRSARAHEIRDLLLRNGLPTGFYPADAADGRRLLAEAGAERVGLPAVVLYDGQVLADPTNADVAAAIGVTVRPGARVYDVAVVGSGPAGLAASVYAASEGLAVAVIEPEALGGQAGTSSLIRNYLGFPHGVSGAELASRGFDQASLFGAELIYGSAAVGLRAVDETYEITLDSGATVRARAVVLACGVAYSRLGVPAIEGLVGAGVVYGSAVAEAQALAGQQVYVVGGGNSAGQAAMHLARYAAHVTVLIRGDSLSQSMSDYLVRGLEASGAISVRPNTEVVDGGGAGRLEWLTLRDRRSQATETVPAAALFVLIGALPHTGWLGEAVRRDRWGYLMTGTAATEPGPDSPARSALETSLAGVFAVGDVRQGSVKRVASAVGEGSVVVSAVHDYLATSTLR